MDLVTMFLTIRSPAAPYFGPEDGDNMFLQNVGIPV
jgi:hypothetical protein